MYDGVMDFSWYDGKLVSLPNGRSCPVMYYNVDALKAAGFETAPATWDELRAASKAVTKDGAKGYGISLGDSWYYLAALQIRVDNGMYFWILSLFHARKTCLLIRSTSLTLILITVESL